MKKTILFLAMTLAFGSAQSQNLLNQKDSISYAYGVLMGTNLKKQGATDLNFDLFLQALQAANAGSPTLLDVNSANKLATEFSTKQRETQNKKRIAEGNAFLEENKKRTGVNVTNSGLQYEVITVGTGEVPKTTDKVTVHYHGTLLDGTVFDSSVKRGQPATFPVNGVIAGWVEALQMMNVGSKWKLFIPSNLAYGERGTGPQIGPYSTLIFEVELLGIEK